MKKFVVLSMVFSFAVLTGCQSVVDTDAPSALVSAEGVKAESFLPDDTFMVTKVGADSAEQRENLEALAANFPQEAWNLAVAEIIQDFNDEVASAGMTFEGDVLPAIGDSPRGLVGFFGQISETEEPEIIAVVSIADPEAVVQWMEDAAEEGSGQKQSYKEYAIYSGPEGDSYVTLYKDVLVAGSRVELVREALDRADGNGASLLNNENYQRGMNAVSDGFAFFYIDPGFSADLVKSEMSEEEQEQSRQLLGVLEAMEGEVFAFIAEEDGIRIDGAVYGDAEKWEKIHEIGNFNVEPAYLYNQLPGDGLIMYAEGSNLKKGVNALREIYGSMEGFEQGIAQFELGLQSAGLSLEDDVLSFMDRGYAFALYDTGGVVPGMGIFVDASSNPEAAEKVMGKMAEGLQGLVTMATAEIPGILNFNADDGEYSVAVDVAALPEEELAQVPPQLLNEDMALYFGVSDDDLAYIALYPGFDSGDFATIADSENFSDGLDRISGYDRGVTFMDMTTLMNYVDKAVAFGVELEGGSMDDLGEYLLARSYLEPVKSLIMSAGEAGDSSVDLQGFVTIGE